eukprot:184557-Pelagomonas_calceolata.AAC.1
MVGCHPEVQIFVISVDVLKSRTRSMSFSIAIAVRSSQTPLLRLPNYHLRNLNSAMSAHLLKSTGPFTVNSTQASISRRSIT